MRAARPDVRQPDALPVPTCGIPMRCPSRRAARIGVRWGGGAPIGHDECEAVHRNVSLDAACRESAPGTEFVPGAVMGIGKDVSRPRERFACGKRFQAGHGNGFLVSVRSRSRVRVPCRLESATGTVCLRETLPSRPRERFSGFSPFPQPGSGPMPAGIGHRNDFACHARLGPAIRAEVATQPIREGAAVHGARSLPWQLARAIDGTGPASNPKPRRAARFSGRWRWGLGGPA